MHELSVVSSLIELCEQNAKANNASRVHVVEIKVGRLSGIEPHLLQTSFDTFKEKTVCEGAELVMHIQDLVVRCSTCEGEHVLKQNVFLCPTCSSSELKVVDGEDMYLMRLEME